MVAKRTSTIWNMSNEEFLFLINKSNSVGEVLQHFGLYNKGNNYKTINNRCLDNGIMAELCLLIKRGKTKSLHILKSNNKKPDLSDILVENSSYKRGQLKKRLIEENIIPHICFRCSNTGIWNEEKLVLILDHINGVYNDNRITNLRFVCPNCNSQLDTFAGRNLGKSK